MENKYHKKIKAFTFTESIASIIVVAVIIAITACSTLNFEAGKEKNLVTLTKLLYNTFASVYQNTILVNTQKKMDIRKLEDYNDDGIVDSTDLRDIFSKYTGAEKTRCNKIESPNQKIQSYLENVSCSNFSQGIQAGFYLNLDCDYTVEDAKDYAMLKDYSVRNVKNTCGYIIYGLKNIKEYTLGKELFVIPLGKMSFK